MRYAADEREAAVTTKNNDDDIKYGDWNVYDVEMALAEEKKSIPPRDLADIWPHWNEGIPKKLRRTGWAPAFRIGRVYHQARNHTDTLELTWTRSYHLSFLGKNNHLLPSNYTSEWSGVYRIFAPEIPIPRCCGEDPTGTVYLGCVGSRGRNWSILRTRIQSILKQNHHAITNWGLNDVLTQKYPWGSLSVEWAYTGKRLNYKGESIPEAIMAEGYLLSCYRDSYGELPPLNEKR
jgi:hypothetical protein